MEVLSCPRKEHILKLTKENNELVSATHRLKLTAPDGKKRLTDTLDSEGIIKLAKNFPNNRVAIPFHRKKHAPQKKSIHTNFINVLAESDKIETFLNVKIYLPAVVARIDRASDYVVNGNWRGACAAYRYFLVAAVYAYFFRFIVLNAGIVARG